MDEKWDDELSQIVNSITEAFSPIADAFKEFSDAIAEILPDVISEAVNICEKGGKERKSWLRMKYQKPRPLFLDKRTVVHRCRNNC